MVSQDQTLGVPGSSDSIRGHLPPYISQIPASPSHPLLPFMTLASSLINCSLDSCQSGQLLSGIHSQLWQHLPHRPTSNFYSSHLVLSSLSLAVLTVQMQHNLLRAAPALMPALSLCVPSLSTHTCTHILSHTFTHSHRT